MVSLASLALASCGGSTSPSVPVTRDPPSAPGSLAANAISPTEIDLSWSASSDAVGVTGYLVERCQGAACTSFAQIATSTAVTYQDTGLAATTSYSYRVRATNAAGLFSAYSSVATASTSTLPPPSAPGALSATTASTSQINLAWSASVGTAAIADYLIERCQGAACTGFAQIATSTTLSFSDVALTPANSYSYRVRAADAAGNLSAYSVTATAVTQASPDLTPPSAPSSVGAVATSSIQVTVSWSASTDNVAVAGYDVERCQGAACSAFAQIATTAGTTFNDVHLTPATAYSYRIRATDTSGNLSAYSAVASVSTPADNIVVTVTPVRGGLAASQAMTLTATIAGDVAASGVSWSSTLGIFTNQTTTTATYLAPSTAGSVTITATSIADPTKTAAATFGITDIGLMGTYHNDNSRDGANTREFALTTQNVNTATFGKLFSCPVDGAIYAQPLWIANLSIGGVQHNVVVVATQHDSVYAFDADASPCVSLWHVSLIDAAHGATAGETSVPSGTANFLVGSGVGDIKPEIGVTGTPVMDGGTSTLYVVSKSAVGNALPVFQRLHALSLIDGSEKFAGPTTIMGSVPGTGDESVNSVLSFDPQNENQRPGLALANGNVYVGWASHEDKDPFHGWLMAFNAATLALIPNGIFSTTPNQVAGFSYSRGGVWMSGGAPAVDANGNLYLSTGNGTFDAQSGGSNFGDSTLKITSQGGLSVTDWFTPADQSSLDASDTDHGSGGATLLMNIPTGSYLVVAGKEGTVFLLYQNSLGHYGGSVTPANSNVRQNFNIGTNIFATGAFWNNSLYVAGVGDYLQAFAFDTNAQLFNAGASSSSGHGFRWPGATPSVSSLGTGNGIAWAIDSSPYCTTGSPACVAAVLYAFDATNLATELWDSSMVPADQAGFAIKFTVPTVVNGKVYIGTRGNDNGSGTSSVLGELDVYGLKPN